MSELRAFVHEADLDLVRGTDERAPGGAVTVALCGHWEHDGRCRWPHNNAISVEEARARFRTLFVAPPDEEGEVRARIEQGLAATDEWRVVATRARPVAPDEDDLAGRLLRYGAG
jgi:hypothetical protein